LSKNKIHVIDNGFLSGINPTYLDLSGNGIEILDYSVFRKQGQLETLILSWNMLRNLETGIFSDCTKLRNLSLSANRLSEISTSAFYGLEFLEHLDLSNNSIEELSPRVFDTVSFSTNRGNHQVSKLKHINLAQNNITIFNFEPYFPMNSNSDSSNPTFQLDYLNVSSNRLTMLDAASIEWLNQTTAVTDLTANPWNCDCSVLLEVWRGLKHKLTLHYASPRQFQGTSWDMMDVFCSEDMNYKSNTSSEPVIQRIRRKDESDISDNVGGPSVGMTALIVTGVLLVCAVVGGIILVKLV
jgi:hypothetical protein